MTAIYTIPENPLHDVMEITSPSMCKNSTQRIVVEKILSETKTKDRKGQK